MNLCEALKLSPYVTTPDHNGIILADSDDEWHEGFSRIHVGPTGIVHTFRYSICCDDLRRTDWRPVSFKVQFEEFKEEKTEKLELPENGL